MQKNAAYHGKSAKGAGVPRVPTVLSGANGPVAFLGFLGAEAGSVRPRALASAPADPMAIPGSLFDVDNDCRLTRLRNDRDDHDEDDEEK